MVMLFRSAYFLVKKERPYSDFPDIIELQSLNGLSLGETYLYKISLSCDKKKNEFLTLYKIVCCATGYIF